MSDLDKLYVELIGHGLVGIRNASRNGDLEYVKHESEHLHEIPSLIGLDRMEPHLYYLKVMRRQYLDWVEQNGSDHIRQFVDVYYRGLWKRIGSLLGVEGAE